MDQKRFIKKKLEVKIQQKSAPRNQEDDFDDFEMEDEVVKDESTLPEF